MLIICTRTSFKLLSTVVSFQLLESVLSSLLYYVFAQLHIIDNLMEYNTVVIFAEYVVVLFLCVCVGHP